MQDLAIQMSFISVYLLEDLPVIRLMVRELLEGTEKYKVVGESEWGSKGLAHVRVFEPDLVIINLELLDTDGLEVVRQLRREYFDMKIIAVSSQYDRAVVRAALQARANGIITKFALAGDLLDAVTAAMNGETYISSFLQGGNGIPPHSS